MSLLRRVGRRFLAGDILSSEASPHAVGRLFTGIVSHLAAPSEASPLPPLQALIGILSASSEPPLPSPLEGVRSPSPLPLPRATKQPFIGNFSPFKSYPLQVIRESLPLVGHSFTQHDLRSQHDISYEHRTCNVLFVFCRRPIISHLAATPSDLATGGHGRGLHLQ